MVAYNLSMIERFDCEPPPRPPLPIRHSADRQSSVKLPPECENANPGRALCPHLFAPLWAAFWC